MITKVLPRGRHPETDTPCVMHEYFRDRAKRFGVTYSCTYMIITRDNQGLDMVNHGFVSYPGGMVMLKQFRRKDSKT